MPPSDIDFSKITFWLDAQFSPSIAKWLVETYGVKATSLRSLGLKAADDIVIFREARKADVIFISKDKDMKNLVEA